MSVEYREEYASRWTKETRQSPFASPCHLCSPSALLRSHSRPAVSGHSVRAPASVSKAPSECRPHGSAPTSASASVFPSFPFSSHPRGGLRRSPTSSQPATTTIRAERRAGDHAAPPRAQTPERSRPSARSPRRRKPRARVCARGGGGREESEACRKRPPLSAIDTRLADEHSR